MQDRRHQTDICKTYNICMICTKQVSGFFFISHQKEQINGHSYQIYVQIIAIVGKIMKVL